MRRDIKKGMKKAAIGIVAATMLTVMAAPVSVLPVSAATVTRGSYDFSNMVVRRVWFNTNDPVFLIDDYERVWLDNNVNVLATGNATDAKTTSNLMAPMKNMFAYIGADYKENGDNITITMNDTTVKLKIGSSDVEINGKVTSGALTDEQIPAKVNVKEKYADYNTFLTEDYNVVYLPVAYVLNIFGADMYKDGKMSDSFYAAVPVMKTESVPSYETSSKGYGMRYDALLEGTLDVTTSVADLIVALQNEDGGFQVLPDNYEMSQKETGLGSMKDVSSVYNGATTSELKYLAKYITANKPEDSKYQDAFVKGIKYLLTTQRDNGGWSMNPGSGSGFNANIEVGNKAMTEVLTLLSDIAILNNQDYVFAQETPLGNLANLFLVADGMGGHNAGDYASRYAVETVVREVKGSFEKSPVRILGKAIKVANDQIRRKAGEDVSLYGMGTTMVAATLMGHYLQVANVGDSRLYIVNDEIRQITRDHSLVEEMVRMGGMDETTARNHPDKNIITRAVGARTEVEVDFFNEELRPGDLILMCSDGLTNMLEDEEILKIMKSAYTIREKALCLIDGANEHGGKDNIAVIIIDAFAKDI